MPQKFWGAVIAAGIGVAGSLIGDRQSSNRQTSNTAETFRDQWDYKRSQGLTPTEIVGTPTSNAPTPSNTLGNNPAIIQAGLQRDQQKFMANQAQLDREAKQKVVETQVAPHAGGLELQREQQPHKINQMEATLQQTTQQTKNLMQQFKRANIDLEERWLMKLAGMSAENGLFALLTYESGLDIEKILKAQGASASDIKAVNELINKFIKFKSHIGQEVTGGKEIVKDFVKHLFENTLGLKIGQQKPTRKILEFEELKKPKQKSTFWQKEEKLRKYINPK